MSFSTSCLTEYRPYQIRRAFNPPTLLRTVILERGAKYFSDSCTVIEMFISVCWFVLTCDVMAAKLNIVLTVQYAKSNIQAQICWNTVCVLYASPIGIPNTKTWSQACILHYVSSEIKQRECVPYFMWGFHITAKVRIWGLTLTVIQLTVLYT